MNDKKALAFEILGSGGAVVTPRPGCFCRICESARTKGIPYSRTGPSVFVHGANILIDMPGESAIQLGRSRIERISVCLFTHWHPDHTEGLRALELNMNWLEWRPDAVTAVHILPGMKTTFQQHQDIWNRLAYLEGKGLVTLIEHEALNDIKVGPVTISALPLPFEGGYGYLFSHEAGRCVVCLDEVKNWIPPRGIEGVELAILPLGIVERHPLTKEARMARSNPLRECELSWEEALAIGEKIRAKKTIYTHLSEPDNISVEEFKVIGFDLSRKYNRSIEFGHDTQIVTFD